MADLKKIVINLLNTNVPLVYALGTQLPENKNLKLLSSCLSEASAQNELQKIPNKDIGELLLKLGEFVKSGIIANRNLTTADNSVTNGTFPNALYSTIASLQILATANVSYGLFKKNTIESLFSFYKKELNFYCTSDKTELISMTILINKIISSENLIEEHSIKIISADFLSTYFKSTAPLQTECVDLFKTVIKKYASERNTFFKDFQECLPMLDMNCLRKYDNLHIHTKIFLHLIETFAFSTNNIGENQKISEKALYYRETFKTLWTNIAIFLEEFINVCDGSTDNNSLARELFKCFIQDLLSIAEDPHWPIASLILTILIKVFLMLIKQSNSSFCKRKFLFDCIQILVPMFAYFKESADVFEIYKTLCKIFPNYSQKVDFLNYKNPVHVRLLLQKYLLDYNMNELDIEDRNDLYLCVWIEEYYQTCNKNLRQMIKFLLQKPKNDKNDFAVEINVNEIDTRKLIFKSVFFIEDKDVFNHFAEMIEVVPKLVPTLRTQVFEFLKDVCLANPQYLLHKRIKMYITRLLYQKPKDYQSTRDIIVTMFSNLVRKDSKIREMYLRDLYDTIFDVSITVNKKAITMFAELIDCQDFTSGSFLPVILLRRFDGVENTVTTTLVNIFQMKYFTTADKDTIVQLTELVTTCIDIELNKLEQIINLIIKGEGKQQTCNASNIIHSIIGIITDRINELLQSNLDSKGLEVTKLLTVLELFSRCAPVLIADNIAKLAVVLEQGIVTNAHITKYAKIAENLLIEHKIQDTKFLLALENSLLKLLKYVSGVAQDIMSLLHHVVKSTRNYTSIKKHCRSSYQFIIGHSNALDSSFDLHLGILAAYLTHFSLDDLNVKIITAETLQEKVINVFIGFIPQKQAALAGLAAISTRHINIILQKNVFDLFQSILKDKANSSEVLIILKCILNILKIEQAARKKPKIDKSIKNDSLKGLGDGSKEYSATIKIVASFLDDILTSYLTLNVDIRLTTVKIIHSIVSLSIYGCDEFVPHLLALLTDSKDAISFEALQVLTRIHNRFPKILQNKAVSALRQSFLFQTILNNDTTRFIRGAYICQNTLRVKARTHYIFDNLKSPHRRTFLANIIDSIRDTNNEQYRKYIFYLAENIINFDYSIKEDVFFLIKKIDVTLSECQYSISNLNEQILKPYESIITETKDYENIPNKLFSDLYTDLLWIYGAFLLQTIKLKIQKKYNITEKAVEKYCKDVTEKNTIKSEDALIINFVTLDETPILKRLGYIDYLNNVNNSLKKAIIEHINEILNLYDNDIEMNSDAESKSDGEDKDDEPVSRKRKIIMYKPGTCYSKII